MGTFTQIHESPAAVHAAYINRLQDTGWNLEPQQWPLVAWRSTNTERLLEEWGTSQTPAEMTIVIVPPKDKGISSLPLKALGYIASALSTAESLKQRHGVHITHIRVLSPVHVNVDVNGGDKKEKLANAAIIARLVDAYTRAFHPDLCITVHSDTGEEITDETRRQLQPDIDRLTSHEKVQTELRRSARQHNESTDESQLAEGIALYLLAHGPAWGYTAEELLFSSNGIYRAPARIVYVPQSELRFFTLAAETGLISSEEADKVMTLISGKHTYAPYYSFEELDEPTIGDIVDGHTVEQSRNKLSGKHGDPRAADAIAGINMLVTAVQQARKSRRNQAPTIKSVLQEVLPVA